MLNVLNSVFNHSVDISCPNWESSPEKRPLKATRCASTAPEVLGATSKVLWRVPVEFKEPKCSLRKDEAIPLRALYGNVEDFKSKFSKPVQRGCNRRYMICLGCALNSLTHSYHPPAFHGRSKQKSLIASLLLLIPFLIMEVICRKAVCLSYRGILPFT